MVEYRLRWIVDNEDNFVKWQKPQLLGDAKTLGFVIEDLSPCISSKGIMGLNIKIGLKYFLLKNQNEMKFEFIDKTIKSSVKIFKNYSENKQATFSINRFTEEMIEQFSTDEISVLDQLQLSQMRHEM